MLQFAASITMSRRIWPWVTEGDLKAVVNGAPMLYAAGRIRRPVTWDMVKEYVSVTGPLDKKAWEMTGMDPSGRGDDENRCGGRAGLPFVDDGQVGSEDVG